MNVRYAIIWYVGFISVLYDLYNLYFIKSIIIENSIWMSTRQLNTKVQNGFFEAWLLIDL